MPTQPDSPISNDKRRATRTRRLREGNCVFNNGYSDLSVIVRNISSTGAKLCGDQLIFLPEEFELRIHDGLSAFTSHWVKRIWSRPELDRRRVHRFHSRTACGFPASDDAKRRPVAIEQSECAAFLPAGSRQRRRTPSMTRIRLGLLSPRRGERAETAAEILSDRENRPRRPIVTNAAWLARRKEK